jgi:hypothetical protein
MRSTLSAGGLDVGTTLPDLDLEITASLVVGGALASRDFTPVHHDRQAAVDQGLPAVRPRFTSSCSTPSRST